MTIKEIEKFKKALKFFADKLDLKIDWDALEVDDNWAKVEVTNKENKFGLTVERKSWSNSFYFILNQVFSFEEMNIK